MPTVLALETSTTSAKAMLVELGSGKAVVRTRALRCPGPDPTVRDPDDIFAQAAAVAREVCAGASVDFVALSGTWHGLTLQSRTGTATPAMEWPNRSASALCARLRADPEYVRWFYGRTGCLVHASYPAFKLRHLHDEGLDLRGLTAMDQGSVTFERLTGRRWMSTSVASGTGLMNLAGEDWDAEVLDSLGVGEVRLPEIVAWDRTAPLSRAGAAALGLRPGVPVLPCEPDGGLSQVGDGASEPGAMTFTMGTSGGLRFATVRPVVSPALATWCYRSPLTWLSGAVASGCGNCVDWAKDRFFPDATYAQIEAGLGPDEPERPPVFLPFLFGERCPGWQDRRTGGFLDVRPEHSAHDLYRGVLLGVVLGLRHCYRELVSVNGVPQRVVLSGGVLESPVWTRMCVDAFGVPMEVSPLEHSSLAGAVELCGRLAGVPAPGGPGSGGRGTGGVPAAVLRPDPTRADYYAEQFARYLDCYERTAP